MWLWYGSAEPAAIMAQREHYGSVFKARVAVEAITGQKTVNEIASVYEVHPSQVAKGIRAKAEIRPPLGVVLWVLLGLGLCSSIPIAPIGPSFIVWPSTSEIAGLALFVVAVHGLGKTRRKKPHDKGVLPNSVATMLVVTVSYVFVSTIFLTSWHGYSVVYPAWSLMRFFQWAVIVCYVLFACGPRRIKLLVIGLVIGGAINAVVAMLQRYGYLSPQTLFAHVATYGAGPYGAIAKRGVMGGESLGVFSYTRIATGFFLALSLMGSMLFVGNKRLQFALLILFTFGIVFTGSRLGFGVLVFLLVGLFLHGRHTPVVFHAVCLLAIVVIVCSGIIQNDFVIGRLAGRSETYSSGIEGRLARQLLVLKLPASSILFGCGLGNLGSALGLPDLRLYRAHGWFFTYLGELGTVGFVLLSVCALTIAKASGVFRSSYGVIVLGCILLSGLADDFMIPSAQAAHLPVIAAIVLRLSVSEGGYRIVFGSLRQRYGTTGESLSA